MKSATRNQLPDATSQHIYAMRSKTLYNGFRRAAMALHSLVSAIGMIIILFGVYIAVMPGVFYLAKSLVMCLVLACVICGALLIATGVAIKEGAMLLSDIADVVAISTFTNSKHSSAECKHIDDINSVT